nr:MAG TPA: spore cortex-lytic enzyme [Caudoviricetes sp.]
MKQFQWAIAVMCLLLAAWLIIVALAFPAKAKPPEMNAEGLCVVEVKYNPQPETAPIYTDADITALAQMLYGESRGCTLLNQQQCVWCVLNRVDDARFPDSIIGVVSQPGQFYGYSADFPVWDSLYAVALDVVQRWAAEKQGAEVARELGSAYLWFTGDGQKNVFRAVY